MVNGFYINLSTGTTSTAGIFDAGMILGAAASVGGVSFVAHSSNGVSATIIPAELSAEEIVRLLAELAEWAEKHPRAKVTLCTESVDGDTLHCNSVDQDDDDNWF